MNINFDFLNSKEFYNLMQICRKASVVVSSQEIICYAYDDLKKYIKSEIDKQTIYEEKRHEDFNDID